MPDTPTEAFIHLMQGTVATLRANPPRHFPSAAIADLEAFSKTRLSFVRKREQAAGQNPYVLSLVGLTNVGKSTLMQALLGYQVAPAVNGPATAIPVEYKYGKAWTMKIKYRAAQKPSEHFSFPDAHELEQALTKRVVDVAATQAQETAWVTVQGPMELLADGLIMADTPGFGAAQTGDADGTHQQRVEEFIVQHVHRVYFCVAAGDCLTVSATERDFYQKISALCGHVVITKWQKDDDDEKDDAAKAAYRQRYQHLFTSAEMIFVNSRKAGEVEELKQIIASYATPAKRLVRCVQELYPAWLDIHDNLETIHKVTVLPWRQDLLRKFANACRSYPELENLVDSIEAAIGRKLP